MPRPQLTHAPTSIAKFYVSSVKAQADSEGKIHGESIEMGAVCPPSFDPEGLHEDNDFARWSPSGQLSIYIANPNLFGKFKPGEKFYLAFHKAEPEQPQEEAPAQDREACQ